MIGLGKIFKGGSGSGNFGHEGRPGEVGGSGEGGKEITEIEKILGENIHIDDKDTWTVKKYLDDLSKFNPGILSFLKERGNNFYIGDKGVPYLNTNQDLKGVSPRGWPEGSTWDNVRGCYRESTKSICAGAGLGGSASVIGHETGHAIYKEFILKNLSVNNQVKQLHKEYYTTLGSYYKQDGAGGSVGVKEMVAESIAHMVRFGKISTKEGLSSNKDFSNKMTTLIKSWGIMK